MALSIVILLLTEPAFSGDDDKESAYKIYIDPETGKYTTDDPHAVPMPSRASALSDLPAGRGSNWRLVVAAILILALSVAGIALSRRRKVDLRL